MECYELHLNKPDNILRFDENASALQTWALIHVHNVSWMRVRGVPVKIPTSYTYHEIQQVIRASIKIPTGLPMLTTLLVIYNSNPQYGRTVIAEWSIRMENENKRFP